MPDQIPDLSTLAAMSQEEFQAYLREQAVGMIRRLLEEVMVAELSALLQGAPHERSQGRRGYRNGYYRRDLVTRFGAIEGLRVPRDREGRFRTRVFGRYRRRSEEVEGAIRDMFIGGLSTGKEGEVVGVLLGRAPSPSTVSRIFHELEAECAAWRERPLAAYYRYIFLDGTFFRVGYEREFERIPMLAALGVKEDGTREVLGVMPGDKESRAAWEAFVEDLKRRGVASAGLWITDGGSAVIGAVEGKFPGAVRQRCVVHKVANVLTHVPAGKKEAVREDLKRIFYWAGSKEEAQAAVQDFTQKWERVLPEAVRCLHRDLEDCLRFYDFPKNHWRSIRSINYLERVFGEVKKRTRLMGALQNEKSCVLIFYAVVRRLRLRRLSLPA